VRPDQSQWGDGWVNYAVPQVRRQTALRIMLGVEGEPQKSSLASPGRAQRVSGHRFGRAACHAASEQGMDNLALHGIVERGTGAVQVQVADLGWVKCRVSERRSYGCGRSPPLRMGGAHMMAARAFASAGEAPRLLVLGQQEGGRALPNIDAGAIDADRFAAPRRNRLESSEPAHRRLAQCIRAANQSG